MNSGVTSTAVISSATLLLGATIGVFASLLLERTRLTNGVATKLVETYLELRRELCDEISELASLRIGRLPDVDGLLNKRDVISRLYFRYFDFLPAQVLQELNCLYACLGDRENRIYVVRNNELRLANEAEVAKLIEEISLFDNFKYYAYLPLLGADRDARRAASINYQARHVLRVVNSDLSTTLLLKTTKALSKTPRGARRSFSEN